jgi:mono/diheme cytochrome c family protein
MRALLSAAAAIVAAVLLVVPAAAQPVVNGADQFHASCASCHGEDGRGEGPMAKVLTVKPADLTQLTKRNNGKFPTEKVTEVIDGRIEVPGHGTRAMPVWGVIYEMQVARDYGPYGSESVVKARIATLVRYLETIQQK